MHTYFIFGHLVNIVAAVVAVFIVLLASIDIG